MAACICILCLHGISDDRICRTHRNGLRKAKRLMTLECSHKEALHKLGLLLAETIERDSQELVRDVCKFQLGGPGPWPEEEPLSSLDLSTSCSEGVSNHAWQVLPESPSQPLVCSCLAEGEASIVSIISDAVKDLCCGIWTPPVKPVCFCLHQS